MGRDIQDRGYGLPRIYLPRTPVNKGMKKGPKLLENSGPLADVRVCSRRTSSSAPLLAPPVALLSGRRAWRAEDIHPVFRRDGAEPLHVRRAVERWRQNTLGGGLTGYSHEPLEQKRLEANKRFTSIGRLPNERMGHPLRAEGKRTGRQGHPSITDIEGELTLECIEPLVFLGMDV